MKKELKSCPFCPCENLATVRYVCGDYFVQCRDCGSTGSMHTTEEQAIEAWNNRVELDEYRERLSELLKWLGNKESNAKRVFRESKLPFTRTQMAERVNIISELKAKIELLEGGDINGNYSKSNL